MLGYSKNQGLHFSDIWKMKEGKSLPTTLVTWESQNPDTCMKAAVDLQHERVSPGENSH